jgi:Holliday junction resolvase
VKRKNCKQAGNQRENQVKKELEKYGWEVKKPKVSLGPADLLARRGDRVLLIQVKANYGNAWMNFRKDERAELLKEAEWMRGTPFLVHWPPYGECKWYPSRRWPHSKGTK